LSGGTDERLANEESMPMTSNRLFIHIRCSMQHRCVRSIVLCLLLASAASAQHAAAARTRGTRSGDQRRIVGGTEATGAYEFVTKITKLGGHATTCTGSLIAERWMLTAAHCILNAFNNGYRPAIPASNTEVVYGCLDTTAAACKRVGAVAYMAHPCYTPSDDQDHDDIALIKLSSPVEGMEGKFALVNGLNGSVTVADGSDVILAGYGATAASGWGPSSAKLLEVVVPKVTKTQCVQKNPFAVSRGYIDFDNVICTGGGSGKDSCNGDSGNK
jgi:secreted trypsin-like serine protease